MKTNRIVATAVGMGLTVTLAQPRAADAAEITVLYWNGLRAVMEELIPQFERATKHKVIVKFGPTM